MLFIDSTHVAKVGSDVTTLFFDVLPTLKPGVLVHIHDVLWPFEYPRSWYLQGRSWNEAYLLRAFLQYNEEFEILLFNSFLGTHYAGDVAEILPLCAKNPGGSLWLRRRG